jgi:hypothetical protein
MLGFGLQEGILEVVHEASKHRQERRRYGNITILTGGRHRSRPLRSILVGLCGYNLLLSEDLPCFEQLAQSVV